MNKKILFLAGLMSLSACNSDKSSNIGSEARYSTPQLQTSLVKKYPSVAKVSFEGTIEAINQATVSAQTAGRIALLPFDIGDYVKQGATIAKLTSVEQNASVEAASSQLGEANALAREARQNFARSQDMYSKKLIATADFDRATAAVKASSSRVETAQAALSAAQENLSYTDIKAPYAGVVATRHVQVGEVVAPGSPILSGVSLDALRVVSNIPHQYLSTLRDRNFVTITLPNASTISSSDIHISPSANSAAHTFRVQINIHDELIGTYPGSLVKVSVVTDETQQLFVPAEAVVKRGEIIGVYTIKNSGLIHLNYIRIGDSQTIGEDNSLGVPVLSGLSENDVVALDPIAAASAYKLQRASINASADAEGSR